MASMRNKDKQNEARHKCVKPRKLRGVNIRKLTTIIFQLDISSQYFLWERICFNSRGVSNIAKGSHYAICESGSFYVYCRDAVYSSMATVIWKV